MTSKAFERDRAAAIARQRSLEAHRTAHATREPAEADRIRDSLREIAHKALS